MATGVTVKVAKVGQNFGARPGFGAGPGFNAARSLVEGVLRGQFSAGGGNTFMRADTLVQMTANPKEFFARIDERVWRAVVATTERLALDTWGDIVVQISPARKGIAPLAASTLTKRRLGKMAGRTPAVPRFAHGRGHPLLRSGKLDRNIILRPEILGLPGLRAGRGARYIIEVDPSAMTDGATPMPLARLATILEHGAIISIPLTAASRRYLQLLRDGRAGPPDGNVDSPPTPSPVVGTATARIPARPVWRNAYNLMLSRQPHELGRMVQDHVQHGGGGMMDFGRRGGAHRLGAEG